MPGSAPDTLALPLDQLPDPLPLTPPVRTPGDAPRITLRPPGSKSLTNRALLLAALADGTSTLRRPLLDADDAQRMLAAIELLGAKVQPPEPSDPESTLRITGTRGTWPITAPASVNLNNAGTATRFLAASALRAQHPLTIDGNERMRERPIGELSEALRSLGCTVEHTGKHDNCPPLTITAPLATGSDFAAAPTLEFGRTRSSQFLSAFLLVGPSLPQGLTLKLNAPPTSASYLRMTLNLLDGLGAHVQAADDLRVIRVGPPEDSSALPAFDLDIEPDASGATYWYGAGALLSRFTVGVEGLDRHSLQGDALFPSLLKRMGARVKSTTNDESPNQSVTRTEVTGPDTLAPIMADMADMPDAAMTLAAVAAFATGPSILRGLETLRDKECDRIAATQAELAKIGVEVTTPVNGDAGAITITPPPGGVNCSPTAPEVAFDTYDDHRMAMSLALIALRRPNVVINDPACVAKTYPNYWQHFAKLIS
ncbi:MAG: 3-phosphoshikimate 1-carboxyvinyltransferase [Planctomycetota bacterium]